MQNKKLKVLELFAGTRSISKEFEKHGHECFTIELDKKHKDISLYENIMNVTAEMIIEKFGYPDIIWASPDCTTYSVAALGTHRKKESNGHLTPKTEYAEYSDNLIQHVIKLIEELNPRYYYIENPRGGLRKMDFIQHIPRYTVTYCQYGENRMKPTDLWTNHPDPQFKPMCKKGMPCHEAAPRGSKAGTQGQKNAKERSVIPELLCKHIVTISEM